MSDNCCNTICGTLTIDGDISSTLQIDDDISASVAIGNVVIRDGTNDYNELVNHPSIEGHTLIGDSLLNEIGVWDITEQDIDQIIYG